MKAQLKEQKVLYMHSIAYYLILPLMFGYLSTLLTGFSFGISNNVFHIAYVLDLASTPEFKDDAYYATLKNMTTIIWPVIKIFSAELNVHNIFYIAFVVSRVLAYVGIVYLLKILKCHTVASVIISLVVVTLSLLLNESSIIGDHGMFTDYFSHSEMTWLFVFLSIGFLSLYKIAPAYAMAGIAFSINAFVGIWLLLINTFTLIFIRKTVSLVTLIKAVAGFALFAMPVILWIYFAVGGKEEMVDFKYIDYIRQYNPQHFLIEATGWNSIIKYIFLFCSGIFAARHINDSRFWVTVQIGAFLIILIGIPLPYIFDSRFIFNLHLIRSAGIGQAIATILIIISGVKLFIDKNDKAKSILGIIIILSVLLFDIKIVNMLILMITMAASYLWSDHINEHNADSLYLSISRYRNYIVVLCSLLFVAALTLNFVQNPITLNQKIKLIFILIVFVLMILSYSGDMELHKYVSALFIVYAVALTIFTVHERAELKRETDEMPQNRSWNELVAWVNTSNLHGPFLLPNDDNDHSDYFQLQARKKVWVDWKQGAAVMWSPSFYNQWSHRTTEVSVLHTPEEYMAYAQKNGIHYLVLKSSDGSSPMGIKVLKRTPYYLLCEL